MTMQTVGTHALAIRATSDLAWSPPANVRPGDAGRIVASFVDAAATALGRATHYNSRDEQQKAELAAHAGLLDLDRALYALLLTLPGVLDRARQVGIKNLLATPQGSASRVDPLVERRTLGALLDELPPQRLFKLFEALQVGSPEEGLRKANNARTRKLVLRTILGSERIELWAIKYRSKMRAALTHAWGVRMSSILRAILAKDDAAWTSKERSILHQEIDRHVSFDLARAYACVGFVLGNRNRMGYPLLASFEAAKSDISAGQRLPLEVLEGIRSAYHKATPKDEVLRLTAHTLTRGQRIRVQRQAEEAKVDVRMDPADYDAVRLYVYAFEMGHSEEITRALRDKARKAAQAFPARYGSIGILVDASASMLGSGEQRLRPMATALALRDVIAQLGRTRTVYAGHTPAAGDDLLVRPSGDTSLAEGLMDLLEDAPEAVFVLSDGYENRPAGRFAEVVTELRGLGIETPIYHLNPVFAAESGGVRELAPGLVPTLPAQRPESLGLSFLRGMLEADPIRGINALIGLVRRDLRASAGAGLHLSSKGVA